MPFKTLYKGLCGVAKFDVNLAVDAGQFKEFCYLLAPEGGLPLGEKIAVFEKVAEGQTPQFAGALDNPVLVAIVDAMHKYKPAEADA